MHALQLGLALCVLRLDLPLQHLCPLIIRQLHGHSHCWLLSFDVNVKPCDHLLGFLGLQGVGLLGSFHRLWGLAHHWLLAVLGLLEGHVLGHGRLLGCLIDDLRGSRVGLECHLNRVLFVDHWLLRLFNHLHLLYDYIWWGSLVG